MTSSITERKYAAQDLMAVYKADRVWNGITSDQTGRLFASFPSCDKPGFGLAEIMKDGSLKPYPDDNWNKVMSPPDPNGHFVRVNAARVGPDGYLWVVDAGAEGIGAKAIRGGARLIVIDTSKNSVIKIHDLSGMVKPKSYIDDIRFEHDWVYITDAGEPGLGLLNLKTGTLRRMLSNRACTTDQRPMLANGKLLHTEDGRELRVHADQLEVSPDGQWLYFQPSSGPLYRVATADLKDEKLRDDELNKRVSLFFESPTTGGTAIDKDGVIYLNDTNKQRILRITPDGQCTVLISDLRLIWADAMWIDKDGYLWIPATQQNLTPGFNGGKMEVKFPVWLYKLKIGASPAALDHS